MKRNLLTVMTLLVMLSMLISPAAAQTSDLESLSPVEGVQVENISDMNVAKEPSTYIILLDAPPVALYQGDIDGLEATSPDVLGLTKLDVNKPAVLAYTNYLEAQQEALIQAFELQLGRAIEVRHQYYYAINGMSVMLYPTEIGAVAQLPGVKNIEANTWQEVDTDEGPTLIGAPSIWDGTATGGLPGTKGEGVIIGDLDTGINMDHPSFADVGDDGYDHTNPYGPGVYVGWCNPAHPDYDPTLVCNDKLIGVYDYADPYGETDGPNDNDGHGSHTASTAAGNVVITSVEGFTTTISGVAPHANIIAYDVCVGGSCPTDAVIAGIDQAIYDGVDVLNESIGIGGDSFNGAKQQAYLGAFAAGILASRSAGNSGPGPASVGPEPVWTMSSGANTHGRLFANTVDVTGPTPVDPELEGVAGQIGTGPEITETISAEIRFDSMNVEGCDPFTADFFDGTLALISRGSCNFSVKVDNATDAGAVGVIVYNSRGGAPIIMGGLEATTIPSVMVDQSSGEDIRDWILANPGATAQINAEITRIVNPAWQNIMADFSSRGPAPVDVVKPDVTAPGVNILAAYKDPEEFEFLQGTSMASPHTAGSLALLRGLYPTWSAAQIRSALMTSALNQGVLKEDAATPATPFDMGAGRLNLNQAGMVGLVLNVYPWQYAAADPSMGGDPKALNLPSMQDSECYQSCGWSRTVQNPTSSTTTWEASYVGDGVATITPSTITISPGEFATFDLDLNVIGLSPEEWHFGYLVWSETSDAAPDVKMPVAVYTSSSTEFNTFTKVASTSEIAVGDTAVFSITVTNNDFITHTFNVTDTVPANSDYVSGTATGGLVYDSLDNALYGSVELGPASMGMFPTSVYGYVDLSGFDDTQLPCSSSCDETIVNITGLAPYYWNGQQYDSVAMISDGYAIPGGGSAADVDFINQDMPDPTAPNNVLAPWWTDIDLDGTSPDDPGGGRWYAAILQDGPYLFNVLEWQEAQLYGDPTSVYTFQIWMLSGTDFIWYVYAQLDGDVSVASVGGEDSAGVIGTTLYYNGTGTLPAVDDEWEIAAVPGESSTFTFELEATDPGTEILNEAFAAREDDVLYSSWALVDVLDNPRLEVAHLAPFAMDPGTAVTVTLDSTPVLTDFMFADSTGYISVDEGSHLVEIFPEGSSSAAISGTVDLMAGMDYSAIATGDGTNQDLGLMALVDDNTPPAAGMFHLRVGHLAPFAAGDALADVRLNDGTVILDDVAYGDVTSFMPLPAGEYNFKITSSDGSVTYIDPAPVTFNDGDIVSLYAVGDGVNQPLGVFAWPAGEEGYLVPLEEYILYLPLVFGPE